MYPATRPRSSVVPADLACTTALLASYDTVVRCLACNMVYTSPRPDSREILEAYRQVADTGFLEERHARELTYRRLLKVLNQLTGGRRGRLLDAGCSMGFFLREAQHEGWNVEGLEPSHWAAEHARKEFGLPVHEGPIASISLEPASFDVITIWDVVEHLVDPVGDFRHLARALKPGGVFALSTHSIESLSARMLGGRYPFLMAMHVTHFTPRTTAQLFELAGLSQAKVQPHLRTLRVAYLLKKLEPKMPRLTAGLRAVTKMLNVQDRYVVIAGLGIFNAFAIKQ